MCTCSCRSLPALQDKVMLYIGALSALHSTWQQVHVLAELNAVIC